MVKPRLKKVEILCLSLLRSNIIFASVGRVHDLDMCIAVNAHCIMQATFREACQSVS